jgi:hypothetical protein
VSESGWRPGKFPAQAGEVLSGLPLSGRLIDAASPQFLRKNLANQQAGVLSENVLVITFFNQRLCDTHFAPLIHLATEEGG